MSVYKGLDRSSVFQSDYVSKKKWDVSEKELKDLNIRFMRTYSGSIPYYYDSEDDLPYNSLSSSEDVIRSGSFNSRLTYEGIRHSFYSGSLGDGTFSGSLDLSPQTTLTVSGSRVLDPESYEENRPGAVVISFPRDTFYYSLLPGTVKLNTIEDVICYVKDDYVVEDYFEDLHVYHIQDLNSELNYSGFTGEWENPTGSIYVYDKELGELKMIAETSKYPYPVHGKDIHGGDIIYSQGFIIITKAFLCWFLGHWGMKGLEWRSSVPIFTYNTSLFVKDIEFNNTFNPTAPDISCQTGSFKPYITEIGLYNGADELLAIAKLSKPIPKEGNVDTTINVRIDLT